MFSLVSDPDEGVRYLKLTCCCRVPWVLNLWRVSLGIASVVGGTACKKVMHCEFRSKSIKGTTVADASSAGSASSTEPASNTAPLALPTFGLANVAEEVDDAPVDSGDID